MLGDKKDRTIPSNRITNALDRALDVLGTPGKQAVFDELILEGIQWNKDEDSIILAIEKLFKERFEKGASYLISRFKNELASSN